MLIKLLFQKFIVYIMNNLCAKFGCHISSNSKDKQGGRNPPPPPGIECFKSPRSDRVKHVTSADVERCLKGVKRSKSTGLDDLPPGLLKDSAAIISLRFPYSMEKCNNCTGAQIRIKIKP